MPGLSRSLPTLATAATRNNAVRATPDAFDRFEGVVTDPAFLELLDEVKKDPGSAAARQVVADVVPFLSLASANVPCAVVKR